MHKISWFLIAVGSALLSGQSALFAQDARPPVQVIVGPNGIKVIDPKTGKELPSVVTRLAEGPARIQIEIDFDNKDKKPMALQIELEKAVRQALNAQKVLEFELQLEKAKDQKQPEPKIVATPQGKIILLQPGQPLSTDKKIDLLLKQMDEVRRDVEAIKKKLDVKGAAPEHMEWRFKLAPGTKLDKETMDRLKTLMDALRDHKDAAETKPAPKKKPVDLQADIERRLERMLQEAEEIRREIRKMQDKK